MISESDDLLQEDLRVGEYSPGCEVAEYVCTLQRYTTDTNPKSIGSVGHPELCKRPCIFFVMGKCSGGWSCNFCHGTHSQRATHLDKINRVSLNSLSSIDQKHLMLSAIKDRALQELPLDKSASFLNLLKQVFGSSVDDSLLRPSYDWRQKRLFGSLVKMPLNLLFFSLLKCDSSVDRVAATRALHEFSFSGIDYVSL
jgi:hypothetical protein